MGPLGREKACGGNKLHLFQVQNHTLGNLGWVSKLACYFFLITWLIALGQLGLLMANRL
jgi:hypothetical protein